MAALNDIAGRNCVLCDTCANPNINSNPFLNSNSNPNSDPTLTLTLTPARILMAGLHVVPCYTFGETDVLCPEEPEPGREG